MIRCIGLVSLVCPAPDRIIEIPFLDYLNFNFCHNVTVKRLGAAKNRDPIDSPNYSENYWKFHSCAELNVLFKLVCSSCDFELVVLTLSRT